MKMIKFKFEMGQDVVHFTGIHGRITAMYHRAGRNSYEFSFCDNNGIPTTKQIEECELSVHNNTPLGFDKKKENQIG